MASESCALFSLKPIARVHDHWQSDQGVADDEAFLGNGDCFEVGRAFTFKAPEMDASEADRGEREQLRGGDQRDADPSVHAGAHGLQR